MTNLSSFPIEFLDGFLSKDSINLHIIKDKYLSDGIEELFSFDGYALEHTIINPQEKYCYVIDLDRYYPSFSKDLHTHNMIIFWHVKLQPESKEHEMLRFGGYLVVDQKKMK